MLARAAVLWVVGLLTLVPYATYQLFFHAPREQYAFLITFVLFWIFGYWGAVGPLIAALKARRVFRTLEQSSSKEELIAALRSPEARDVTIDLIASENHIPRFVATRVYSLFATRLLSSTASAAAPGGQRAKTDRRQDE